MDQILEIWDRNTTPSYFEPHQLWDPPHLFWEILNPLLHISTFEEDPIPAPQQ